MRDPKRIDRILDKVKTLWKSYPDQRLLQLFDNYLTSQFDGDLFFVEDEETEKIIDMKLQQLEDWKIQNNK
jgi:hypothetical protein